MLGAKGLGSMGIVACGSLVGAAAVAFLGAAIADWQEGLIREPWQLEEQLNIEVLAQLDADLMRRARAELSQGLERPAAGPMTNQTALARSWDQSSSFAPSPLDMATPSQFGNFRQLRTRLLTVGATMNTIPFTTLVVPLVAGSGGSFVARNLAAAFAAQDGASALLVDCNLARPSQHLALRTGDDGGLFDFLDEPQTHFAPKPTAIPGLYLIPCGRPRSAVREYFSSNRMRGLVHFLRDSGHFVFIDGPPAKGSSDARVLSEIADLVILVVGAAKARSGDVTKVVAMFEPAKLVGIVFNEQG
jgi:Mrp family chromosome partitioning ATPase